MSRFYDLLRTVGGSEIDLIPTAGKSPEEIALPDIEIPPIFDQPLAAAPPPPGRPGGPRVALQEWEQPDSVVSGIGDGRDSSIAGKTVRAAFGPKLPVLPNAANAAVSEYYRRLRTKLLHLREARSYSTVAITSAAPQEGKTITALNLGLSLAMVPSLRVAIVDADLRRCSLGALLGMTEAPGFSNLVDGTASLSNVLCRLEEESMYFIGPGTSREKPGELLQTSNAGNICRRLGEAFDIVLIDTPPVNVVTDTALLVKHCDAVLLVARAFATTRKAFEKAFQEVQHRRVLGTVLNGATRTRSYRGYKDYSSYY